MGLTRTKEKDEMDNYNPLLEQERKITLLKTLSEPVYFDAKNKDLGDLTIPNSALLSRTKEKDMTKKYPKYGVRSLLTAYKEDLRYHLAGGDLSNINHFTSGTPEFASVEEAEDYLSDIDIAVDVVQQFLDTGKVSNAEMLLQQERDDYERLEAQNIALRNVLYLAMGLVNDRRAEMILQDYANKCGVTIATTGE